MSVPEKNTADSDKSKAKPETGKERIKAALYWCASCGGCEETVVDLHEKILDVVQQVEIVLWPCAMDFKYKDVEAMPDKSITVSFINGAIRTSEQEEIVKLLRKKSVLVVAFGSCAALGGIPALTNLTSKEGILERSYLDSPTVVNPQKILPKEAAHGSAESMTVPEFYQTVYKLSDIIDVDYFLPGCPPTSEILATSLGALLSGQNIPKGSTLLPEKSLCSSCERNETKLDDFSVKEIHRIHEVIADPKICFLSQGIICMGPATRGGCHALCVKGNMPCTGCFGPLPDGDQGSGMIAALGGVLGAQNDEEMSPVLEKIPDPAGSFYRYSLSASILGSKRKESSDEKNHH